MRAMNNISRKKKIERLAKGKLPRVLDLFSGCGGISLGFHKAGFHIVAAIELDPIATRSHSMNFLKYESEKVRSMHSQSRDITLIEPDQFIKELGLGAKSMAIDVVVGGPPCQAFARVGRSKLRELAAHPEAFLRDPRSNLYLRYLHYVKKLQPLAILFENVPDVLNYGGHNISEEMCEVLSDLGYRCGYTLLNSAYYGVPQMRERMFLIAYAAELGADVVFPSPTHWLDLPRGYEGSRQVALKYLNGGLFDFDNYFYPSPKSKESLPPAITAEEALGDLPPITDHLEGKIKRGAKRFDKMLPWPDPVNLSNYARQMREWPKFENSGHIRDHVIRVLPRDYAIFRRMKHGDQYPEAYQHALDILQEKIFQLSSQGRYVQIGSAEYEALKKRVVPPYDPGKFPNKWRKMESDKPARTLMAHLGKDGYSHIHYDSNQARTISVREAARLQSFPDGFAFAGTMNPAFRQIGNSVPPLMAAALAEKMMKAIKEAI